MKLFSSKKHVIFLITIAVLALTFPATLLATTDYLFTTKWGTNGIGDSQFWNPMDISSDSKGNVFVADYFNHRIQKFNNNGVFISKWGSKGSANGQFFRPKGVCTDPQNNIFVVDTMNLRMQKFDNNGNYLLNWSSWDGGSDWFSVPNKCATDSLGNVFVTDGIKNRVIKFNNNGNYISKWGYYGTGNGEFNQPEGIAVNSLGDVYVSDFWNHRIQKFNNNGVYITKWGSLGSGDDRFNNPSDVAVDPYGRVIVADLSNNRIQKFDSNGNFMSKVGSGAGQFNNPYGISSDFSGNVFVADTSNDQIQKFSLISSNLLQNPSFELDDNTDGMPDSWTQINPAAGDGQSADTSINGSFSMKMVGDTAQNKLAYQHLEVSGNASDDFVFYGMNKTDGATAAGGFVGAVLYLNHTDGTRTPYYLFFDKNTHDWVARSKLVSAYQNYTSVDIVISYGNQTGTAYFDDFKLYRTTYLSNNMDNSSFETDADLNNIPDSWLPVWFDPTDGRSTDFAKEGSYSLKVVGDLAKNKLAYQHLEVSGNASDDFVFYGMNKTDGATAAGGFVGAVLYLNHTDGTRTPYYLFFDKNTHDWVARSKLVSAYQNYTSVDIVISYGNQTGTAYFDDFKLLK